MGFLLFYRVEGMVIKNTNPPYLINVTYTGFRIYLPGGCWIAISLATILCCNLHRLCDKQPAFFE